jgi:flagella basal body P-ring formation protein FlgA
MLLGFALAVAQIATCQSIQSDHIYARDLAAVIPAFGSVAPAQPVSLGPIPGQRRVFRSNELTRIARSMSLNSEVSGEVCFEWTRHAPDREQVLAAMRSALRDSNATVELVDLPANPIPAGSIAFPLTGISGFSDGPVSWRGTVTYAANRSIPIWARVRITAHEKRVVAAQTIEPNRPITAADVRVDDYTGPFRREKNFADLQQVIGLMGRSTIVAGTAIGSAMVRDAVAVERGDTVQVVVQIARTRIETEGIAEESGPRGAVVTVRNQKSGRRFRARVEERDKVMVLPTSMAGLAVEDSKS